MNSSEIREDFLRFFEGKGHTRVASAPVVLPDDPTLLFTNAGMNPFKDVFLGQGSRDYTRAVDTQKCIRVSGKHNDLEEVGVSERHHTFFEMLGNWSFGDYFKREAIGWAWELLTTTWGLPKERIWGTVFEGNEADGLPPDEEAEALWGETTDLPASRIVRLPAEDVFWEMGNTGPCGPSSELHIYLGDDPAQATAEQLRAGHSDFLELWNLVFIQFNRDDSGSLHPLPSRHIDTGMGFERICSVIQNVPSNFDIDLFQPLLAAISDVSRKPYDDASRVAFRVIADHIRALTFAIADGVVPSNEGRGYVLRRILRRASRFGRNLDIHEPFIYRLTETVASQMGDVFPEVRERADYVARVIRSEEEGFGKTLDRGLELFEQVSSGGRVSGADAFQLYDTFGFPIDLTQLMAAERGIEVDLDAFQAEMDIQQTRSREAGKSVFASSESAYVVSGDHSEFIGYDTLEADAKVVSVRSTDDGQELVLDATPFYSESGGQVGDHGVIQSNGTRFEVSDTRRVGDAIVHFGKTVAGDPAALENASVTASVDAARRLNTARNHSATHLLHAALRRVLGDHVQQAGSLVTPDRLRFDFNHFNPVEPDQLREIEAIANASIRMDLGVEISYLDLEKAKASGATMLFTEKYGDIVRSVRMGDVSFELCGGTHVESTGQIGLMLIPVETGTAAGIRRIEAVTGPGAEDRVRSDRVSLEALSGLLNTPVSGMVPKVEQLIERNRQLERELQVLRRVEASSGIEALVEGAADVDGVRVVAGLVETPDMDAFREMADRLREMLGSGVGVLGANLDGKASLIVVVTDDLVTRGVQAGSIVKDVARVVEGGGGGRPHMAQAGGRRPEKLPEALDGVPDVVRSHLQG